MYGISFGDVLGFIGIVILMAIWLEIKGMGDDE